MGAYLSAPNLDVESAEGAGPLSAFGTSSMQGWRRNMEDAHVCRTNLTVGSKPAAFFAVFDGHGGSEVADYCQRHWADEMDRELAARGASEVSAAMTEVFLRLDRMLISAEGRAELRAALPPLDAGARAALAASVQEDLAAAKSKGSLTRPEAAILAQKMMRLERMPKGGPGGEDGDGAPPPVTELSELTEATLPCRAGCTAVAAVLFPDRIACANAGDSRCVLCDADGHAVALSHDHKPSDPGEKARIEAAGGWLAEPQQPGAMPRVCGSLNLSRSIGDLKFKVNHAVGQAAQIITADPDVIVHIYNPGDRFVVLACDGVWDVMSSQDVVDFVSARLDAAPPMGLSEICEEIMRNCLAANPAETRGIGCDNMTCTVVVLTAVGDIETVSRE